MAQFDSMPWLAQYVSGQTIEERFLVKDWHHDTRCEYPTFLAAFSAVHRSLAMLMDSDGHMPYIVRKSDGRVIPFELLVDERYRHLYKDSTQIG